VTAFTKRGLRGDPKEGGTRIKTARKPKVRSRRRRVFRLLVRLIGLVVLLAVLGPAVFIGTTCYSGSATAPATRVPPRAVDLPGYARPMAFTYLTLPEWFIVYSADEYAAFISRQPPSAFPYVGSVRQYWGYYSAACTLTKGVYPFETGYHVMLGTIGASFTLESFARAAYEGTIGRLTEWLASTDTTEDAFARRTWQEYGAFMHNVPWYEFPFGSKLMALWRDVPLRGPHVLRKIERRFALTAEYGAKAAYGFVIRQASGAAYDQEVERVHATVDGASAAIFSDARVKQVQQVSRSSYIVTLPRYEGFTRTALALTERGVRFLDVAGNDEILVTALTRRGASQEVPDGRLVGVGPVLTDPTMQRVAVSVPVSSLGGVAAYFAREHAVIEHLYDY
jgi:hypothetical protein